MVGAVRAGERVGVTAPHLLFERARDRLGIELPPLLADDDLKREMQQDVAELVTELAGIRVANRLVQLEDFFHQVGTQRLAGLSAVPRTTRAQVSHECERASNRFIALHLASGPRIIRAPVNVSISGRDSRAWVEVDLAAIVENARSVARIAGTRLLPVVKANAYGVGAVAVSRALESLDPVGYCVATVEEGAELREAGITRPILVFMPGRPDLFDAYCRDCSPVP